MRGTLLRCLADRFTERAGRKRGCQDPFVETICQKGPEIETIDSRQTALAAQVELLAAWNVWTSRAEGSNEAVEHLRDTRDESRSWSEATAQSRRCHIKSNEDWIVDRPVRPCGDAYAQIGQ